MSQYLTYSEYLEYGGKKPETEFAPLECKARKAIDYATNSRVKDMVEVPEAVKLCMVSVMNIIGTTGAEAQAANPVVTSFTTDGYPESYGHAMDGEQSQKAVSSTIRTMLYGEANDEGIPLLYRGVVI